MTSVMISSGLWWPQSVLDLLGPCLDTSILFLVIVLYLSCLFEPHSSLQLPVVSDPQSATLLLSASPSHSLI